MDKRQWIKENINKIDIDDMWTVVIFMKDSITHDLFRRVAMFHDRYDAEQWFSTITKDKPYYAKVCGEIVFNKVEELLED